MPPRKRRKTREIVPSESKAIAVLSSSLVLRGLREFPHNPTWRVKQAFTGTRKFLSISPRGYVATYSAEGAAQSRSIEIHDLELSWLPTVISIPGEPKASENPGRAALGWSPSGKSLLAASSAWPDKFHFVDAYAGTFGGCFGKFSLTPEFLCWSGSEKYFAACSDGSESGALQLWKSGESIKQFNLLGEVQASALDENSQAEDLGDQGKLWGFGSAAFHPDEKSLAAVLEYDGEWSDDSILLLRVPTLGTITRIDTTGHVTGLAWSRDGQKLFFCASGQVYVCNPEGDDVTSLPFAAELCCFHPTQPMCAFYNSWLKSSEKGRIFIADSRSMNVIDECSAEGILDLRWSADGRMLYAVAQDGSAYLYEHSQS
jgi:WD40 repeat protein